MPNEWTELAKLADLKFQQEAGKLEQIKSAQSLLSQRKRQLAEMDEQAVSQMQGPHEVLARNGDVAWQAWVGRNKRQQGIEEAQLRAILEIRMPSLRKAYGRKAALEQIIKDQKRRKS